MLTAIRSILSMPSLTRRSRANAAVAMQSLRGLAHDYASAEQALEQARRGLGLDAHPAFAERQ